MSFGRWLLVHHAVLVSLSGVARAETRARVTLAQVLAHAERHAPAVVTARARLGLGEAALTAASPLLPGDPELEISAGPRISSDGVEVDIEATVKQRLEIAGERGLRLEAAERTKTRLRVELDRARWQVHRRLHAGFHAALVARERVQAAEHLVRFAGRLLDITKRRHAAGAISMLHVKVAEGEAAQAAQRKIHAAAAYRAACLELAETAGWPVGAPPEPAGALEAPRSAPPLRHLMEQARVHHAGLRARRAAVDEAEARNRLARREAFPKPAVGVTYSREVEVGGAANHIVLGTLELSLPIWRRNHGQRARASARVAVVRARHRALQRALSVRVTRASESLDAAARRIAVYGREVVPAFERSLQMIGRAYSEGKVDVLQVMVARARFLEIQREALGAYEDYYRAHAALEAVVGAEIWRGRSK
jgi:cobalt-zinc-cadmium efflux system outer membrane protein